MTAIGNMLHTQEYLYDFAKDGGLVSTIILSDKAGMHPIPVGAVVKRVIASVLTAVVGTTSTLAWGNTDDTDGYSGTAIAEANLTADAVFNGYDNAAALIWDDTNDHAIDLPVTDADSGAFSVDIGTNVLTAGKVAFMVEFYMPGQAD